MTEDNFYTKILAIIDYEAMKIWRAKCLGMELQMEDNKTIYGIQFADDQIVLAQDMEDLEFIT